MAQPPIGGGVADHPQPAVAVTVATRAISAMAAGINVNLVFIVAPLVDGLCTARAVVSDVIGSDHNLVVPLPPPVSGSEAETASTEWVVDRVVRQVVGRAS
jgi:hypothetical protein